MGFTTYVDARDGSVLVREDLVDYSEDNPAWESSPTRRRSTTRRPIRACGGASCPGPAATRSWARPRRRCPGTSKRRTGVDRDDLWEQLLCRPQLVQQRPFKVGKELATPRPNREYTYAWTNQWFRERCSPAVFETAARNDIDAARANLFAMHNRMHDWSYHLGFTEATFNLQDDNFGRGGKMNDPEQGNAQAGGVTGGPPTFAARQRQPDHPAGRAPPITNMYLWQPIAGTFYAPCVDGDFDMSVIGHEYTHAITNRMVAGPNNGLSSPQGMSESWSDLVAVEYLAEHGYAPAGSRAFTIGQYVTSDPDAGIRNYNMSASR